MKYLTKIYDKILRKFNNKNTKNTTRSQTFSCTWVRLRCKCFNENDILYANI